MRTLMLSLILALSMPLWAQKADTTVVERDGKKIQVIVLEDEDGNEDQEEVIIMKDGKEMDFDFDFDWDEDDDDEDEKRFDPVNTRWFMLDVGKSLYIANQDLPTIEGDINPMDQRIWGSWNIGLHLFKQKISLYKGYVNLKWGISFDYSEYRFDNDISMVDRTSQVTFVNAVGINGNPIDDFDKNELQTWYLNVPLELHFETNPSNDKRSFRLSAGGFAGIFLDSQYKQEYDIYEVTVNDDFNLNNFRYGLTGSIGYGWFNLYGNYALNGLFSEDGDGGYAVSPLNVGIKVVPF